MPIKKHILRFRTVNRKNFNEVQDGLKAVETRAAIGRYQKVRVGDILVFVCGKSRLNKKVKKIKHFSGINSMLKTISMKKIMPSMVSVKELRKAYYSYPGYKEKIKKFGILAFYI